MQKIEEQIGKVVSLSAFYVSAPRGVASENSFLIAAAVAAAACAFCVLSFKPAPPTQAIVVTGFGLSRPKVVCGRGVFVLPIVQRADRLNMRLLKIDVKTPETGVKTKEGVSLWLDSVVTVQGYSENSTVSDEEVEKAWKDACKSAGGAKAFKKTLKTYGYTEDTYKDSLKESLAQQKLKHAVAPTSKPKDSEIADYINENLSNYNDARRSSNILIKVDSDASDEDKAAAKAKAQECLDKINSGELSFEDAVEQYSDDTGSKDKKGDVGWDKLTTFVDSYQAALEGLNKGDVSDVVESTYGYHIIKCTDYFHVDNQVDDIKQVPKDIKKYVSNVVKTQAASTAYSEWLEQYKKDADITVNPMPKDVPYNVSLKGVTKSSTDDSSTTE